MSSPPAPVSVQRNRGRSEVDRCPTPAFPLSPAASHSREGILDCANSLSVDRGRAPRARSSWQRDAPRTASDGPPARRSRRAHREVPRRRERQRTCTGQGARGRAARGKPRANAARAGRRTARASPGPRARRRPFRRASPRSTRIRSWSTPSQTGSTRTPGRRKTPCSRCSGHSRTPARRSPAIAAPRAPISAPSTRGRSSLMRSRSTSACSTKESTSGTGSRSGPTRSIPSTGSDNDGNGYVDDVHGWKTPDDRNDLSSGSAPAHPPRVHGMPLMPLLPPRGTAGTTRACRPLPACGAAA